MTYSFTRRTDGAGSIIYAEHVNELQEAIEDHPYVPRLRSGYAYTPTSLFSASNTTGVMSANSLRAMPLWIPADGISVSSVQVNVTSGVAGALRVGCYGPDETTGFPDELVSEFTASAQIDVTSTGIKTIDLSSSPELLERVGDAFPFLWIAVVSNVGATYRGMNTSNLIAPLLGAESDGTGRNVGAISRSFTYGALPDPFGAGLHAVDVLYPAVTLVVT